MRLTDILQNSSGGGDLRSLWDKTEAAGEFTPIPAGTYTCRIASAELNTSKQNQTPSYCLKFQVCEGEFSGRLCWHDLWLTAGALPATKRDLQKLGIVSLEQLESPLPRWIICRVRLALRRDDSGVERNRVQSFEVLRLEPPEQDPFAPTPKATSPAIAPTIQQQQQAAAGRSIVDDLFK